MTEANRRQFLAGGLGGAAILCSRGLCATVPSRPVFATRGVVLISEDLSLADWPERAKQARLTTIGIHHQNSPKVVAAWVQSDAGQRFLEQCRKLGLDVEYALHAMKELLPRDLFGKNPEFFRMNEKGERTPDANCCVHSTRGLEIVGENALAITKMLRPTTNHYSYCADDAKSWCLCPECRFFLPPSEQSLVVAKRILQALRSQDSKAQVPHLAYANTLQPPKQIKPCEGIFLVYAPIKRRYDIPYSQQAANQADGLDALDANLEVFPKETAEVLEYWLDVSRFSRWKRPAVKLPWKKDVFLADVETYRERGICHITTFANWVDADYKGRFGNIDFIAEYGEGLAGG